MPVKNSYPEKSKYTFVGVKLPFQNITDAIGALDVPVEVKRTAYVVARNEAGVRKEGGVYVARSVIRGKNDKGDLIGWNIAGVQSDSGRWPSKFDTSIIGVVEKLENLRKIERGFVLFDSLKSCVEHLCDRIMAKGMFIGENVQGKYHKGNVTTPEEAADAYNDEWVYGKDHNISKDETSDFVSMYRQAKALYP